MFHTLLITALFVWLPAWATPRDEASDSADRRMVMDAEFEDWRSIAPALIDPQDAPGAAVDFGEIRITHDDRFVYLLIDFGRTINAQGLDGHAMILLDADGNPQTGRREHELNGVDLIIDLTPPNARSPDRPGMGMGVRSTTYMPDPNDAAAKKLTVYDINLAFAPTHAGRRLEFRIDRGVKLPNTPALFEADRLVGKLVFVDVKGNVADETDSFAHELTTAKPQAATVEESEDPLARSKATDVRVMSWNVARGAMFSKPESFVRTFRAIAPDVILLQELPERNTAEHVQRFLNEALNSEDNAGGWNVIFGEGGGDLRCAVASRSSLQEIQSLRLIPFPDQPNRTLRMAAAVVGQNDRRLLAVSIHLRCCGRAGGPEDETRLLEVRTLNAAMAELKSAIDGQAIHGIVIAGDFNLVGSRDPLEIMAAGLDIDGSAMTIADAFQPEGLSNATWSDPVQPFAPGRLDFMLFADAGLLALRSLVFDSRDFSQHWLDLHEVDARDTVETSDHMPVIVDLQWRRR